MNDLIEKSFLANKCADIFFMEYRWEKISWMNISFPRNTKRFSQINDLDSNFYHMQIFSLWVWKKK